jgi:hypothetical protein
MTYTEPAASGTLDLATVQLRLSQRVITTCIVHNGRGWGGGAYSQTCCDPVPYTVSQPESVRRGARGTLLRYATGNTEVYKQQRPETVRDLPWPCRALSGHAAPFPADAIRNPLRG